MRASASPTRSAHLSNCVMGQPILPPKTNTETGVQRLHVVPPTWRNVQHLPWLQYALKVVATAKFWKPLHVGMPNIDTATIGVHPCHSRTDTTHTPKATSYTTSALHNTHTAVAYCGRFAGSFVSLSSCGCLYTRTHLTRKDRGPCFQPDTAVHTCVQQLAQEDCASGHGGTE